MFNRLFEAGCVYPKHVVGIFQTRSCVVVQNERVSVCLRVLNPNVIAH
jgi:hypothetical protein